MARGPSLLLDAFAMTSPLQLDIALESWPLKKPFRITGETLHDFQVVVVTLQRGDAVGHGEATGVSYLRDTPASIVERLRALQGEIEDGHVEAVVAHMPIGGARNALDCALWDLRAKEAGVPVWKLAGVERVRPLCTTFTLGADSPADMAEGARQWPQAKSLKLKLTGTDEDADRVRRVRAARPDVWMGVDANRGFTADKLERLLPVLVACRVELIEQPFALGCDADLEGLSCPIPIAADESIQGVDDLLVRGHLYDVVNIKLDKCGGLTEGLEMARVARRMGLTPMVGTMGGTSRAMAAGFVVGQSCNVVDLDGPVLLKQDRLPAARYDDGLIWCDDAVWGGPRG